MIFSYCEGDTTLTEAVTSEEFANELREIDTCNRANGYGPARIDPGFDPTMKAAFEHFGLAGMLRWPAAVSFLAPRLSCTNQGIGRLPLCPDRLVPQLQ